MACNYLCPNLKNQGEQSLSLIHETQAEQISKIPTTFMGRSLINKDAFAI